MGNNQREKVEEEKITLKRKLEELQGSPAGQEALRKLEEQVSKLEVMAML